MGPRAVTKAKCCLHASSQLSCWSSGVVELKAIARTCGGEAEDDDNDAAPFPSTSFARRTSRRTAGPTTDRSSDAVIDLLLEMSTSTTGGCGGREAGGRAAKKGWCSGSAVIDLKATDGSADAVESVEACLRGTRLATAAAAAAADVGVVCRWPEAQEQSHGRRRTPTPIGHGATEKGERLSGTFGCLFHIPKGKREGKRGAQRSVCRRCHRHTYACTHAERERERELPARTLRLCEFTLSLSVCVSSGSRSHSVLRPQLRQGVGVSSPCTRTHTHLVDDDDDNYNNPSF